MSCFYINYFWWFIMFPGLVSLWHPTIVGWHGKNLNFRHSRTSKNDSPNTIPILCNSWIATKSGTIEQGSFWLSSFQVSYLVPCHYGFVLTYFNEVNYQVKIHYYGNIFFIRLRHKSSFAAIDFLGLIFP